MINLHVAEGWKDYELLDSGNGQKLEKWGNILTIRPDPRAIWQKTDKSFWDSAEGVFSDNGWKFETSVPLTWQIAYKNIRFVLKPTEFKHTGVFPEQAVNWNWIQDKLKNHKTDIKILNLFAYTGGATIAAASTFGVHVTHVDASRPAMMWASENAKLSRISPDRIRWIQDDCLKFVKREIKRGMKYDGIIMDPPPYGRGPEGEKWTLQEQLNELVKMSRDLMEEKPCFFILSMYAVGLSSTVGMNVVKTHFPDASVDHGEFYLKSKQGRDLPMGTFVRLTC